MTDPERPRGWAQPFGSPEPPDPSQPAGEAGPAGGPGAAGPPSYGPPAGDGQPPAYGSLPAYTAPPGWGGPQVGAPRPGVVPLRPLGLGELLDGAVGVVRRYPRPTLGLSLVVAVASTALGLVLLLVLPDVAISPDETQTEIDVVEFASAGLAALAVTLVTGLAGLVLAGVITAVVGKAVLGQPLTTGQAWQAVRPLLLRLVGLSLAVLAIIALAVAALVLVAVVAVALLGGVGVVLAVLLGLGAVVGAVYLYVRLCLAAPALVLERLGVREALRRSGVLVRGSFWRVLGVLLLAALIAGAVGQVLQLPFVAAGGGLGLFTGADVGVRALVLSQIGAGVAQTLVAPFSSGVRALLYVDRRMRAEGLDVSLAAAAAAPQG